MTRERVKELLPIIIAFAEGKEVQYKVDKEGKWFDLDEKSDLGFYPYYKYRIKHEPKLRPWKPEEVPVGALVRLLSQKVNPNIQDLFMITGRSSSKEAWAYISSYSGHEPQYATNLLANFEHSLDHGKTWHPCGVPIED